MKMNAKRNAGHAVSRREFTRVFGWMAGAVVAVLAAGLPAVHFSIAWKSLDAAMRTEAEIHAHEVSAIINRDPEMWKYETVRIDGILSAQLESREPEYRRILDGDGNVVGERREEILPPVMTRRHPLKDSGETVGTLEIRRSMRPLIETTAYMGVLGTALGLAVYFLLRMYPMSALRDALYLLSREKERTQVAFHSIGDGVITTDSEDRIVLVNRVAEKMTGWTQAEAAGRPIGEVFRWEEGVLVARDGESRLIEAGKAPILDGEGLSHGTVLVFRDITDRARTEAELQKAQKLESLGILAAGIAHEIRNPLSAINISISSIEHVCRGSEGLEPEAGEKVRLILDQMKSAATKMASVVQRVLDFSKPAPPRKELADLNAVIEEAVRLSSSTLRKREIAVGMDLAPDLPACHADRRLIEQVIVNLITNAYQAMEGTDGPRRLEIASAVQEGRIVIPGVPLPLRERIFDPFFTTRKEGSGIGLSFSHRIVDDHGGTLRVGSSAWGGAEFRIDLPGGGEGAPA
jgi:signal transduction histidine kinase